MQSIGYASPVLCVICNQEVVVNERNGTDHGQHHQDRRVSGGSLARWRALTTAQEFGSWFGVELKEGFAAGKRIDGIIRMDNPEFDGLIIQMTVERMEPEQHVSFYWHPYAVQRHADYSDEPPTLVAFELEETSGGSRLTVTESGFDRIPESRRALAFQMNDGGWAEQLQNIKAYVEPEG